MTERNFYQRHKFGVILTAILVILTMVGFGVGFSLEKKSPKSLPPKEITLNPTPELHIQSLSIKEFMARAETTPTLPTNGSALTFTVGKQQTFRFQETYPRAMVIDASFNTAVMSIDSRLELFNNNT